jgi:hypothetical protein
MVFTCFDCAKKVKDHLKELVNSRPFATNKDTIQKYIDETLKVPIKKTYQLRFLRYINGQKDQSGVQLIYNFSDDHEAIKVLTEDLCLYIKDGASQVDFEIDEVSCREDDVIRPVNKWTWKPYMEATK